MIQNRQHVPDIVGYELSGILRVMRERTSVLLPEARAATFGNSVWLSEIPERIGVSLREMGIPGVVRYDGVFEEFHLYTVFCRIGERYTILRLAYSLEETGEVKLSAALAVEPR